MPAPALVKHGPSLSQAWQLRADEEAMKVLQKGRCSPYRSLRQLVEARMAMGSGDSIPMF